MDEPALQPTDDQLHPEATSPSTPVISVTPVKTFTWSALIKSMVIIVGLTLILGFAFASLFLWRKNHLTTLFSKLPLVGCAEDLKTCSDGTTVSRVAPECEFAPCPSVFPRPSISPVPLPSPVNNVTTHKVLAVGFNPVENGVTFADTYFAAAMGASASATEDRVFADTAEAFGRLSQGQIKFEVAKKIQITESPTYPDGFVFTLESYKPCVWGTPDFQPEECERRKQQFNYNQWIQEHRICEQAQEIGATEIWMLSLPYMMGWENFMVGPTVGFNVNGANYIVSSCAQHFIIVNGTYDRPTNVLHNIGHRVEATMQYLTASWQPEDRAQHWERFVKFGTPESVAQLDVSCGNTHFPPNASIGYEYNNPTPVRNNCADWKNFPEYRGTTTTVGCEVWGCADASWQEYWLSAVPAGEGTVTMTSVTGKTFEFPRNWWTLLLSPTEAIKMKQQME
ncbi:MAG TPA: hypothetical protein VF209_01045 [Patescibacteria group bacterium]